MATKYDFLVFNVLNDQSYHKLLIFCFCGANKVNLIY